VAKLAEEKALYVVNEPESAEVEVSFKNPVRELGFAQIEHIIGLDVDLSDGAYRTLSILHYFWQQKKRAFPSLETLAKLRGKSERTVSEHLAELTEKGIISRARRMGTSSMTYLEDLPQSYAEAATAILEERALRKTARKTGRKLPVEA
jgi:DNA-binding transcriptional ArsR family regulator